MRWDTNFHTHTVGGKALQDFLHATVPANDDTSNDYARGLFVETLHGQPRVNHGGAWAGFRAELMRFPEQKTSVVCLANRGGLNPTELCEKVAAIALAEEWKPIK